MNIQIKRTSDNHYTPLPQYAHKHDAGMDLCALLEYEIQPYQRVLIRTGFCFFIPEGYAGLIWGRSGLATKHGITTLAGVIDSGYQGEVLVCLLNTTSIAYKVSVGDKIAQILLQKVEHVTIHEVLEFETTTLRGEKGFGSTDEKNKKYT